MFDSEGVYVIVSDGKKSHTLHDISTSFRQILGRIRDTKYRSSAIHIFKETRYSEFATYEDYKKRTEIIKQDAIKLINAYNDLSEYTTFKEDELNDKYITKVNGKYKIDNNLITYDLMKYKLSMQTYSSIAILKGVQESSGFIAYNDYDYIKPSDFIKRTPTAKIKFQDAFQEYTALNTHSDIYYLPGKIDEERIKLLESTYDFIKDAYYILGVEEVKRLNYNVTNIKRSLINKSDKSVQNKIAHILSNEGVKEAIFISLADCKEKLQNAYNAVRIVKTAKATEIEKYFEVEPSSKIIKKRDKNNELKETKVKGYKIIREKFVFK